MKELNLMLADLEAGKLQAAVERIPYVRSEMSDKRTKKIKKIVLKCILHTIKKDPISFNKNIINAENVGNLTNDVAQLIDNLNDTKVRSVLR